MPGANTTRAAVSRCEVMVVAALVKGAPPIVPLAAKLIVTSIGAALALLETRSIDATTTAAAATAAIPTRLTRIFRLSARN